MAMLAWWVAWKRGRPSAAPARDGVALRGRGMEVANKGKCTAEKEVEKKKAQAKRSKGAKPVKG